MYTDEHDYTKTQPTSLDYNDFMYNVPDDFMYNVLKVARAH